MKLGLRVREPFHLDDKLIESRTLLTDEQAAKVRELDKKGQHELLRRCTQEVIDEPAQAESPAQTESAPAPVVERRTKNTPRDKQE